LDEAESEFPLMHKEYCSEGVEALNIGSFAGLAAGGLAIRRGMA
jgi:hypothetical protein